MSHASVLEMGVKQRAQRLVVESRKRKRSSPSVCNGEVFRVSHRPLGSGTKAFGEKRSEGNTGAPKMLCKHANVTSCYRFSQTRDRPDGEARHNL